MSSTKPNKNTQKLISPEVVAENDHLSWMAPNTNRLFGFEPRLQTSTSPIITENDRKEEFPYSNRERFI